MSATQELRALFRLRIVQLAVLAELLSAVGVTSFIIKLCILDLDIWWHLKVGDWILQHAAVPHTGILSRTAAENPRRGPRANTKTATALAKAKARPRNSSPRKPKTFTAADVSASKSQLECTHGNPALCENKM